MAEIPYIFVIDRSEIAAWRKRGEAAIGGSFILETAMALPVDSFQQVSFFVAREAAVFSVC
ncbi:MAG TPA: hypothetical protein VGI60_00185 [Chthoniobacterales bacterium]|jgi:hypothetical protein